MGRFDYRMRQPEILDDFTIADTRLTSAMEELRTINRFLGGYRATMSALKPFFRAHANKPVRILDIGTGAGDYAEAILRWGSFQSNGPKIEIVGVDANPAAVTHARELLARRLPEALYRRVSIEVADATDLPFSRNEFDVVICALFLHHFEHEEIVKIVENMRRIARFGIVINDLHRHRLAYHSFAAWCALARCSPVVRRDGLLSIRKAFTRSDLEAIAAEAGIHSYDLRWRWAFRWVFSTLRS